MYNRNMIQILFYGIIIPLIITLLLECVASYFLKVKKNNNYRLLISINLITNPIFNIMQIMFLFKFSVYLSANFGVSVRSAYNIIIYIMEVIIICVEGTLFNKYMDFEETFSLNIIIDRKRQCIVYSIILNFISYFGGKIIHNFLFI